MAEVKPVTLYLQGKMAGKDFAAGSKLRPFLFRKGKITLPSSEAKSIQYLIKYYSCVTTAPKASA